jgi:hypothetical protein
MGVDRFAKIRDRAPFAGSQRGTMPDQDTGSTTMQIQAPRTTERLIAGATTARGVGYGRRSARGHGYELRGLSYVPVSRLHEDPSGVTDRPGR